VFDVSRVCFAAILEELLSTGRLAGCISGGTQDKAQYVPDVYTQAQNQWIDAFYKQNGYFGERYFSHHSTFSK